MSSHSISSSMVYEKERRHKTGHYKTYKTNLSNLVENKLDYKRNYCEKRALRDTQIRSMHEIGETKRAQEQRMMRSQSKI